MKKKSIQNFKKLENKDLKKINGGVKIYATINGEVVIFEIP